MTIIVTKRFFKRALFLLVLGGIVLSGFRIVTTNIPAKDLGPGDEPLYLVSNDSRRYPPRVTISEQVDCDPCDFSHTVYDEMNRLLLLVVTWKTDATIVDVTYAGATMTNARTEQHTNRAAASIWYKIDPATGPNTVSVDFSATETNFDAIAYTFADIDQTTPVDADAGAIGQSKLATVDITPNVADAWIIDGVFTEEQITMVVQTDRTEMMDTGAKPAGGSSILEATGPTTYTMDWDIKKSKKWAIVAVSLLPAP